MDPVLAVSDLATELLVEDESGDLRPLRAVDGISFEIGAGRALGLVGESGCGKSMTALSILRLLPRAARIAGGQVRLRATEASPAVDLAALSEPDLRQVRGARVAMVFQEPMTSLNPVYTVGDQVAEPLRLHRGLSRTDARAAALRLLGDVGIADPARRIDEYPHQLSGGMRQRVMIAMALACDPEVLVADEPTTALDVTIQAQILDLLSDLRRRRGMALLLITHDLGVVADTCDEVVVMYAGQVVERATTERLFDAPLHPYTRGLLRALPRFTNDDTTDEQAGDQVANGALARLHEIPGMVPRLDAMPAGCRFAERCAHREARCVSEVPSLRLVSDGHLVRCHLAESLAGEMP